MSTQPANPPLPHYDHPPVVETILGVQFDPIPGLTNAHLGAFWATLDRTEWPSVVDAPPLQSQSEQFSESARWGMGLQIQLTHIPQSRLQTKNSTADRMLQLQNGRFHFNWLGQSGTPYPRYTTVKDGFVSSLEKFMQFTERAGLGKFQPNQWEVTYINHIPQGTVWNSPSDWGFFEPLRSVPMIDNVIQPESFSGEWHFVIPPEAGRLHIAWQHAMQPATDREDREIIQLTMTARGPISSENDPQQNLLAGLNRGHETIVRSFERLMSTDANRYWGLQNA